MAELRKSSNLRTSSKKKKKKDAKSGKTAKERTSSASSSKSKSSKRYSDRFHGMEDTTPRVSHLRKTVSEARVSKARSIPTLGSADGDNNSKEGESASKTTLVDAASAVTNQLSNAIYKLADMTSDFLYPTKSEMEDQPGLVDVSTETNPSTPQSIRLQLETTFSTITTDADGGERNNNNNSKLENSFAEYENSIIEKDSQKTPPRRRLGRRNSSFSEEKKMDSSASQDSLYSVTPDRSADDQSNRSPPPQLLEGRVHAKSSASQHLHRPVPMPGPNSLLNESSETKSSCETPKRNYPKREDEYAYMRTTPIARMRQLEAQKKKKVGTTDKAAAAAAEDVTPTRKSEEELKKEKQRKWRRRMKMAEKKREKERRELYDDATSAVGTTATAAAAGPCKDGLRAVFLESTTSPVRMLQQMIRTRCGVLEDSLSFDSGDDDDSQSAASQDSEELVTTEDEEESVEGTSTSRRNRSQETSYYTESPASESRSLFTPVEERTGPATPPNIQQQQQQLQQQQQQHKSKTDDSGVSGLVAKVAPAAATASSISKVNPANDSSVASMISKAVGDTSLEDNLSKTNTTTGDASGASMSKSETSSARVELNDKNFIKAFIMESSKDGIPLLWHKEEPAANSFSRPSPVMCFLAFGSKGTTGAFEGPRLVWALSDGTYGDSIDLFDIRSLDKASPLQLQAYPFAIPGRSIFVRCSSDKDMVFEAPTESEALRFIHGMRWVVARLAFNLIIGNLDVCCELLNVAKSTDERKVSQSQQLEEVQWAKAMNEVTHQLVEKSVFQTAE